MNRMISWIAALAIALVSFHGIAADIDRGTTQEAEAMVKKAGNNIYFAWAGVEERGGPHYYRIQAPDFLIEYDSAHRPGLIALQSRTSFPISTAAER